MKPDPNSLARKLAHEYAAIVQGMTSTADAKREFLAAMRRMSAERILEAIHNPEMQGRRAWEIVKCADTAKPKSGAPYAGSPESPESKSKRTAQVEPIHKPMTEAIASFYKKNPGAARRLLGEKRVSRITEEK